MKKNSIYKYIVFVVVVSFISCKYDYNKPADDKIISHYKESLLKANKYLVKKDVELIESYANRRGWKLQRSKTGLFFELTESNASRKISKGDVVSIAYKLSLLDGTVCYTSGEAEPKIFKVGHGGVESGLEEAILLMGKGDKGRFILLPHLAYGLIGDENKIPARATIVYEIEVLSVSN